MRRVLVDTTALLRNQNEGTSVAPIIVHDSETGMAERTTSVKIVGPAEMKYEMWPEHNLARVWVEADAEALEYEGQAPPAPYPFEPPIKK